jgi:DNA-binding GntR family transcriptional regulator
MPLPTREDVRLRENAQDVAYEQIKGWIIDGPLEAGEVIRDVEVAQMLGVSRTPVREALIRLSQEGLVEFARGRSTRVAELEFARAPHLFSVGGELDGLAARYAAATLDATHLSRMRDLLAQMTAESEVARLQALDEQFHQVYYGASGNPVLVEVLEQINQELRRFERVAFRFPEIRAEAYDEHIAILQALAQRDGERASSAAVANWANSWARIHHRLLQPPADVG